MMEKNEESTRCKQCGKVIVGDSKLGLCDYCFNKDTTRGVGAIGGGMAAWKLIIKPIINYFKNKK